MKIQKKTHPKLEKSKNQLSPESDDKNDKNISFSERKHLINNFKLNFNDVPNENHDENEKNQEEELKNMRDRSRGKK